MSERTPVRLRGLPGALHRRAVDHHEELRRGLTGDDAATVAAMAEILDAVEVAGEVAYVDPQLAGVAVALVEELDEIEAKVACRAGDDLRAYRAWLLEEIDGQAVHGRSPAVFPHPVQDGTAIVVDGDLDIFGASAVSTGVVARLDAGDDTVEVDLSACGFVDSAGLSTLLAARHRCHERGAAFRVVGASETLQRLFETAGVADLLLRDVSDRRSRPPPPPA